MRRQTSGVRSSRPQRTVPHFWRSSAGKRSTPAKCLTAGGFSMSILTTVGASTSWRRVNTASLVTGVPSVPRSSPSGASLNDLTSIQNVKQKDLPCRFDYFVILNWGLTNKSLSSKQTDNMSLGFPYTSCLMLFEPVVPLHTYSKHRHLRGKDTCLELSTGLMWTLLKLSQIIQV